MKTNSIHSDIMDKQPKYSQFINSQLFNCYRVVTKDRQNKSHNQLSPSDDQKLAQNLSTSQSYVNAMKALQDKIKSLEIENQNLQSKISSQGFKELIKQTEGKQRQISSHNKINENQQIKEKELKLVQMELEKNQTRDEYEQKILQLQQNLINITQQSDQRYREQLEQIQKLQDQLQLQGESNQNYRDKINQQTQAIQHEKQNNNNLEFILDKEKRETKFLVEKNERLQDEISKLKEQLFDIHNYMNWYTKQYDESTIQKLQEETTKYKAQIYELKNQLDQYKEQNLKLQLGLDHKKQELQKSELKRVKKLSESNIQIDMLKQQLISLSSNSNIHTQSPRETQKKDYVKQNANIGNKIQNLRNHRQQNKDNQIKMLDQPYNSILNSQQESFKQQQNDSQSSVFSRLIVKTQEENFLTQQKSDERNNFVNSTDERIYLDQQSANKHQKYIQNQSRIHYLNEQLKILNQRYEDIEIEIQQSNDFKIKREKRQYLLQIIDQIQDINKELNDNLTKAKLAQSY
ncbi:unnamed protein product [Paramecium sonneborni]|uniref:Uncharacterized protein n=1 Tax=Paramecium sonneborni TaxID=65129 RepID=A0A8S1RC07_9CILI|nr:unnamed protein product [Paramecium sonneborni]